MSRGRIERLDEEAVGDATGSLADCTFSQPDDAPPRYWIVGPDGEYDPDALPEFDRETVVESIEKTGRACVVHEAPKSGGFAAEVIASVQEEAIVYLEAPIERVTGFDVPIPMLAREDRYLPNPPRIEKGVKSVVEF